MVNMVNMVNKGLVLGSGHDQNYSEVTITLGQILQYFIPKMTLKLLV